MYASVYFPLVLSALLIPLARVSVRRFAPDVAARALTVAGLMASLCSAWGLALLVGAMAGQDGGVAHEGHWSATLVAANNPVPHWASQLAVCLLLVGAIRLGRLTFVEVRALSAGRALHPARTELVVVDDASPQAFALPGRSARIVVTKGMLRALSPIERKVLLAHERAHLRHNHHRYQLAFALAGALNPFVAWALRDRRYVV